VMVAITFRMVSVNVSLEEPRYKTLSLYLALYALAELFELYMAFDALRLRNVVQLLGILIFQIALLVGAAIQIRQTEIALVIQENCDVSTSYTQCGGKGTLFESVEPFLIVAPCIIAASWLAMIFWIKQLYAEFGWAIFHVVGANPKMKTMYQWYQIMICLLKFDFFFFTGVTMQLLIIVLQVNSAEFGITIAAIPIDLILLFFCGVAVQREIKSVMSLSLVMMLVLLAYFAYKFVRFYEPSSRAAYDTTRGTLSVFTIIAFLLVLGTFGVGIRCFRDFDRGLLNSKVNSTPFRPRYHMSQKASENLSGDVSQEDQADQGVPLGPRLSIEL